jgi:hypothetical protein
MKTYGKNDAWVRAIIILAGVALIVAAPIAATARSDQSEQAASVVAHVPLEGGPATQMFLQDRAGKQYLYVDQGAGNGYTVVDVTKPAKASIIRRGAPGESMEIVQGGIGLASSNEGRSKRAVTSSKPETESIKVMDLSDPANPRTIQSFKGVSSVLVDSKRNVFYLTNDEGLWVLKSNQQRFAPERRKQPCTSEAAIQAMPPDCE